MAQGRFSRGCTIYIQEEVIGNVQHLRIDSMMLSQQALIGGKSELNLGNTKLEGE